MFRARTARPSPPSSFTRRTARKDRRHPALDPRPPSHRPPQRAAKRPRPSFGNPRTLRDGFQRKGRSPSFGRRRGLGAESKRPQNFSSGLSRGILSIRKESPLTGSGPSPARRAPCPPCGRLPRVPNGTRPTRPSPEAKNPLFYIGFYIESDGRKPKNEP